MRAGIPFVFMAAGLVVSCVSGGYREPDDSMPVAVMAFQKGDYFGFVRGNGTTLIYADQRTPNCDSVANMAVFNWPSPSQIQRRVPAGTPIAIAAVLSDIPYGMSAVAGSPVVVQTGPQTNCEGAALFTPIAGRTYRMRHILDPQTGTCSASVVDISTGSPPADLRVGSYADLATAICPNRAQANQ